MACILTAASCKPLVYHNMQDAQPFLRGTLSEVKFRKKRSGGMVSAAAHQGISEVERFSSDQVAL